MNLALTKQNVEKDTLLIEEIRSGKLDFSVVYNNNYNYCKKSLIKKGACVDTINDIYQDAMIVFYNKIMNTDFKLSSKITTYLYGIVYNLWCKEIEKNSKFVNVNTSSLEYENDNIQQNLLNSVVTKQIVYEDQYNEDEIKVILIKKLINNLPTNSNKIINLFLNGMKTDEIIVEMGYANVDTLKSAKNRAISILRNKIKEIQSTPVKNISFLNAPKKDINEMEKLFHIIPKLRKTVDNKICSIPKEIEVIDFVEEKEIILDSESKKDIQKFNIFLSFMNKLLK